MGSLSQPKNPLTLNPGSATDSGRTFDTLANKAAINQIRGVNISGSTGAGIPKPISDVKASVSNASTGLTSVVTVMFHRDPSDTAFGGVTILAKGYQSNNTAVQVGSSTDSPATFVLDNTGEAISLIIQPFGNGGSTPIASCPSVGVQLPKSTAGGVGTSTKTSASGSIALTVPTELSVTGSPVNAGAGGTFAVTKATQAANKVWAGPTSGAAAQPTFRTIDRADIQQARQVFTYGVRFHGNGTGTAATVVFGTPSVSFATSAFTTARVAPTANDGPLIQAGMGPASSANAFGMSLDAASPSSGIVRGQLQRFSCRIRQDQTTNCRFWVGLVASGSAPAGSLTGLVSDTPNFAVAAFRYSSTTDTTIKAVLATSSANVTVVDTGVSVDTANTKLFEITFDGTNWNFWIDGVVKATFNTNQPANTTLLNGCYSVDNKSTANNATASFAWMTLSHF
jgi:hypothetical protein